MIWILLACALGVAAVLITKKTTGDATLTWIVGASFAVRCLAAVALFFVSSLKLPFLQSSQLDHGLWVFGADGVYYHTQAVQLVDSWRTAVPLLAGTEVPVPSLLMAMVYAAVGASPLHFMLVNAWLGAIAGLLAYLIAARLGDRRGALPAAVLVAFWPSSILWSTQLLKDPAVVALELSALLLLVALWQRHSSPGVEPVSSGIAHWAGLFFAVLAASLFRPHIGLALTVSVVIVLAIAFGRALLRNRWRETVAALGITTVVGTATLASATLNLTTLVSLSPTVKRVPPQETRRDAEAGAVSPTAATPAVPDTGQPEVRPVGEAGVVPPTVATSAVPDAGQPEVRPAGEAGVVSPIVARSAVPDAGQPDVRPAGEAAAASSARAVTTAISTKLATQLQAGLSLLSVDEIVKARRTQVIAEGGSLIDTTTFDSLGGVLAYLPRAMAYAYLAPFPWQLMSSDGHTGMLRPLASVEIILIILLVPAIVIGCWERARRFRTDEWLVLAFIICVALGYGVMVPNGGTLFRARLQFLFPSLILASSALPAFVYRLLNR